MTLRMAEPRDAPAMEAFLAGRAGTSMFLRANLAAHGTGEIHHPHGTTFWLAETADGIAGIFGATNSGYLMAQAPEAGPEVWSDWVAAMAGRPMRGITGDDVQVRRALRALGLRVEAFAVNHAEPLYRLKLEELRANGDEIRPAEPGDREMLTEWYAAYLIQTGLTTDPDRARDEGRARAAAAARPGMERLLIDGGAPVACASINAAAADMVQVGGVFVPEDRRNRGYGRRVTAARLAEARDGGARVAILFSNNDAASRAYEAIGFERIGAYRVAVLTAPIILGAVT